MKSLEPLGTRLRKILQLEQRTHYQDQAVLGGLEGFIEIYARELETRRPEIAQRLRKLACGYSLKPPEARRAVVRELEDCARALETESAPLPQAPEKLDLRVPVRFAKGVGPQREKLLHKLGIFTIEDLLTYFPKRIEDRRETKKIVQLRHGDKVTVKGRVRALDVIKPRNNLEIVKVAIQDNTGILYAVWFNQPWLKSQLMPGELIALYGTVEITHGQIQMSNPVWEPAAKRFLTGRLVPVYPATEGLKPSLLYRLIQNNLALYRPALVDVIPEEIRVRHGLLQRAEAFEKIHFPQSVDEYQRAHDTLAFEELFLFQIGVALEKQQRGERLGRSLTISDARFEEFLGVLPFKLTRAQERAIAEIRADLAAPRPMNRLLQGDVGSGKTVVATVACLIAVESGYQAAFMAPTEILAQQHFRKITELLSRLSRPPRTVLLIGSLPEREKEFLRAAIRRGDIDLVIGTHALIQEDLQFKNLGLAVIDEQHRFGVIQRAQLEQKGENLDILVMSATPIPRTITLTLYGQFEISILDELPFPKNIQTFWISEDKRDQVYEFVAQQLRQGAQAYIVFPFIEESEELDVKAAVQGKEELERTALQGFRVGLLHGRMSESEKQAVMKEFVAKELDALVSTTIVEVGIDVPSATVMVIEHADRFGLAQLHQLRGRIGRAGDQSYCFAIATPRTEDAQRRLEVFQSTLDGFQIAEEDLKIRGPGDMLGVAQHGLDSTFKVADLIADLDLMKAAREEAFRLIAQNPEHPLIEEFRRRFGDKFALTRV
ncbi:MAG: ATP-dependent DNA helicase RecG [Candidatus Bipolaricaulota bacterium]|nr:ATP-dependent DNA helicase RecG [Candidatus Bipolaricaulota bacterium]MDW8030426.1 ATP-dependent DNA helicase RecG [Candidatus Bipolaricaulota bacterium]